VDGRPGLSLVVQALDECPSAPSFFKNLDACAPRKLTQLPFNMSTSRHHNESQCVCATGPENPGTNADQSGIEQETKSTHADGDSKQIDRRDLANVGHSAGYTSALCLQTQGKKQ
jgi:hypothetical protein